MPTEIIRDVHMLKENIFTFYQKKNKAQEHKHVERYKCYIMDGGGSIYHTDILHFGPKEPSWL